ncbi:MAG TPA: ATP-binding cassette domain-containing protein [Candidatus Ozemobacteraceae bacterium]
MIRFDRVSFRYGTDERTSPTIVGEVSFCLRPGECLGLAGNNGSGKSTIALLAKGLLYPTAGRVTIGDVDTRGMSAESQAGVGLLFQNPDHQIVGTTIREDIAFGLENLGVDPEEIGNRIAEEAERLDLAGVLDQPVHTLSGGMRQRAALAAVLAARPGFIVLDEPTSQLDPWARIALWKHLEEIRAGRNIGLLVISQHRSDLIRTGRVLTLERGRLSEGIGPETIVSDIEYAGSGSAAREVTGHAGEQVKVLVLRDVSVGHGDKIIRRGLHAEFRPGGVHLIVGPSGSGKTTLLTSLAGFLPLIDGSVTMDGREWQAEGRVGLAFQNPERLFFCETVGDEVTYALRRGGAGEQEATERGKAWLTTWGLDAETLWSRSPLRLSGGEMRRVALAACTVRAPEVLLLDEPLAGLDAPGRSVVRRIITDIARRHIVVTVTHDPEELLEPAASVLLLRDGGGKWFESGAVFRQAVDADPELFPLAGRTEVDKSGPKEPAGQARQPPVPLPEPISWLYGLNPLVKGGIAFGVILMLSLYHGPASVAVLWLVVPLLAARAGGAPVSAAVRDLRNIWLLMAVVGIIDIAAGGWGAVPKAVDSILRLVGVFLVATLYVAVSTQAELMHFWEVCFRPLALFGVNTREPALAMVIAVRFLPVMLEEIERIRLAQRARGAKPESGLRGTVMSLLPLLVPTLTLAIHRAHLLAVAMEARGYRLDGHRTRYRTYRLQVWDALVGALFVAAVLVSVLYSRPGR